MSEDTNPEATSSKVITEQSSSPNHRWYKIILGMPLLVVALYIVVRLAMPGDNFFEGNTSGIYWLYLHASDIGKVLFHAMSIACVLGLVCAILRAVLKLPFDWFDHIMTVISVGFLGVIVLSMFLAIDAWDPFIHLDSEETESRTYHLVGTFFLSRYLVIECDRFDFMCQRIYESDKMGDLYQWNGSLEYDPATDEIRLIDSGNVLFAHKATP